MNINKSKLSVLTLIFTILLPLPVNIASTLLFSTPVLAESSENQEQKAEKLYKDGAAKIESEQYQDAINLLEQALKIYQNINEPAGIAITWKGLGLANGRLAKYSQAIEYYEQGLKIISQIKDKKNALEIQSVLCASLGDVYIGLGNYNEAIKYAQKSIDSAKKSGNSILEANGLNILGAIYIVSRNPKLIKESLPILEKSLAMAIKAGSDKRTKRLQASILNSIAGAYFFTGDINQFKKYASQSLALAKEVGDKKLQSQIVSLFGEMESLEKITQGGAKMLQQFVPLIGSLLAGVQDAKNNSNSSTKKQAFNVAENALKKCAGNIQELTNFLNNIKDIKNLNDYDYNKLRSFLKDCELKQKDNSQVNLETNNNENAQDLPTNTTSWGNPDLSKNSVQGLTNPKIQNTINNSVHNLGQSFVRWGNDVGTSRGNIIKDDLRQLPNYKQSQDRQNQGSTLHFMGENLLMLQNFPQAERTLFEAIKFWESIRTDLGNNDTNKVSYFDTKIQTYQLLQTALIKQNKVEKALEVAERGRARAFIDLLAAQNLSTNQIPSNIPDINLLKNIAKQQQATIVEYSLLNYSPMNQQVNSLYIWVIKPTGEVNFKEIDLQKWENKTSINLIKLVEDTRLSVIRNSRSSDKFSIGDHVKLKTDEPIEPASEIVGKNPKNGQWILKTPGNNDNNNTFEKPESELVKVTTVNDLKPGLQKLHQVLIEPIADFLPKNADERVIFVPQQQLFTVPFPALQDKDGRYLIEKHTILTAPAIQVLDSTHKRRKQVPGNAQELLIIGNPTMPKIALQPGEKPQQLRDLPYAKKEAETIAKYLQTTALTGSQADKNTVISKMPQARIIHLATHGILDDQQGVNSAIALTNSLLTAGEIINLKLNAELVILSACETGKGKLTGDGVIGLSRSLIAAGVPSVIVSLWIVEDDSTSFLMQQFYQNRQQTKDNAQALRQAMLTTIKQYPQPSQWAAFTLIGEAK